MNEPVFEVTHEAEGGFVAECLTEAIFTHGDADGVGVGSAARAGQTPSHCYVRGAIAGRIRFHMQLPLPGAWNGRLLNIGDGDKDGDLDFADLPGTVLRPRAAFEPTNAASATQTTPETQTTPGDPARSR